MKASKSETDARDTDGAEGDGTAESHRGGRAQEPRRQRRTERSTAQFIQRVRRDADREEERDQRRDECRPVHARRDHGAEYDVGEMPRGIGRVEHRAHVTPRASLTGRVERRSFDALSHHSPWCPT